VVLNEVTEIKKLENIRRDFVANVSHELRTPITSIKGFVETLIDGAIHQPEEAERFLQIVARQADRLNAIIEDLLSLSRLETDVERGEVELQQVDLQPVLEAAVQTCAPQADEKRMRLVLAWEGDLAARANPRLIEQALVNLIGNAIKYSPAGQEVRVSAAATGRTVQLQVSDQGAGIDKRHLPRLFERFYRVDKARSRELGGTGLGLAIVKHIALAHGGMVSVESEPGQGSTFVISLPRA
jgi:two-component system phosphate regulon sensor histidine kinase PhoR